jgi:hypothetical protein
MKENEIGGACSSYGEIRAKFLSENLKEKDHLEDLGVLLSGLFNDAFSV